MMGAKRGQIGKPIRIPRPADEAERKRIETDPGRIADFFRQLGGG